MIALLIYKDKQGSSEKYEEQFKWWYKYYLKSGTKSNFRLFTDEHSGIKTLGGFPVTPIKSSCPISVKQKWATYGDWLRADLYSVIKEPFIYLDLDCIAISSLDQLCEMAKTMAAPLAMARMGYGWNSGLICFREDLRDLYHDFFLDLHCLLTLLTDDLRHGSQYLYGENTWGRLCEAIGIELDIRWNVGWPEPRNDMKIFHLYNGSCVPFLRMHEALLESQKRAK